MSEEKKQLKGDFDEKESKALEDFRKLLDEEYPDHEVTDFKIMRFIRARKFDVKAAFEQYVETMNWREAKKVDDWESNWNDTQPVQEFRKLVPELFFGFDKDGLPSYIVKAGRLNPDIIQMMSVEDFVYCHIWGNEFSFRRAEEKSRELGKNVDKFSNIVDLAGLSLSHRKALKYLKAIAKVDERYYPECMGRTLVVNAPTIFSVFWKLLKPWLDPVTQTKIIVLGSDYKKALLQWYEPDQLPEEYGGTGRNMELPNEDTMKEILASIEAKMEFKPQLVKSGKDYKVSFPVGTHGGIVRYYFKTKHNDIRFLAEFTSESGEARVLIEAEKHKSYKTPVKGMTEVHEKGEIVLTWDNSYSFFKDKHLEFFTELIEHDEDMRGRGNSLVHGSSHDEIDEKQED